MTAYTIPFRDDAVAHCRWYRKTFQLPSDWAPSVVDSDVYSNDGAGSTVWLEFDGVFYACVVYLNGIVVARNAEGYLGFRVPLTKAVKVSARLP